TPPLFFYASAAPRDLYSFPTRRSSDLGVHDPIFAEERTQPGSEELGMGERCEFSGQVQLTAFEGKLQAGDELAAEHAPQYGNGRSEEHTSELQSRVDLVCRLLLEKKKI